MTLGKYNMLRDWVISIYSVLGALLLGSIAGSVIVESLDFWHLPGMGFGAAFNAIIIAYLSAPKNRIIYTAIVLILGMLSAWYLMEPSYYPSSYGDLSYQKTHLPIIATYSGALIACVLCYLFGEKNKNA